MEEAGGVVPWLMVPAVVIAGLALYFVPAFMAWARRHHQRAAIFLLNLLLGWTLLGWVAALVWAATAVTPPPEADPRGGASPP
jgi:hypothetical protein